MEAGKKTETEKKTETAETTEMETKPQFPDLYGTCILLPITSHRPPEPFGKLNYKHEKTPGVEDLSREAIGQLTYDDLTFARHPRERAENLYDLPEWFIDNETASLKIVCRISTGVRGAQVVLCEVKSAKDTLWKKMGHQMPNMVVAKIFDPLYYFDSPDMITEADREYAQEAAAYIHMHDQRDGVTYSKKPGMIPRFYGTWTTDITIDHLRKPFMGPAERQATMAREAKDRAAFSASAAAAKASGSSAQTAQLKPQKFRPVRIILLEYIKGRSLSHFLTKTVDNKGHPGVKPTPEFAIESLRLAIFGNIMDTLSRVEHLGIKPINISPPMFMITKRPRTVTRSGLELKYDYDVVMTDFSQADVTKYTRMGFDVHEKLPRPMHPLSARSPLAWYPFYGWVPSSWFNANNASAYNKWGEAFFKITDYSTPDVVNRVAEEEGWLEAMKKAGNLPPQDDDPELQERTRKANSLRKVPAMKYQSEKNFATKEEFDKDREDTRKAIAAQRAEHAEQQRKKRADLVRRCEEKARQLDEEKRRTNEAQFSSMGPHLDAPDRPAAPELEHDQDGTVSEHPQTGQPLMGVGSADFPSLPDPSSGTSGVSHRRPPSSLAGTEETAGTSGTGNTGWTAQTGGTGDTAPTAPTAVTADSGSVSAQGPRAIGGTPLIQHVEAADNNKSTNDDEDLYTAD